MRKRDAVNVMTIIYLTLIACLMVYGYVDYSIKTTTMSAQVIEQPPVVIAPRIAEL